MKWEGKMRSFKTVFQSLDVWIVITIGLLCIQPAIADASYVVSFQPGPSMNSARMGHNAAVLSDGRVALFGGHGEGFVSLDSAEIWTTSKTVFDTLNMNYTHDSAAFVQLADGHYLLTGGSSDLGVPQYATSETFNPADNTFTKVGDMVRFRAGTCGTTMKDGNVLIASAWWMHNDANLYGELYHPATQSFSATGIFSVARANAIVFPTNDGQAVILGGSTPTGGMVDQPVELYNPATNTVSTIRQALFNDETGWMTVYDFFRPMSAQQLADGRYIGLAWRQVNNVNTYRLFTFNPETKTIDVMVTDPALPDSTTAYLMQPVVDKANNKVHLVAQLPGSTYPDIALYSVDLTRTELFYSSNSYSMDYYISVSCIVPLSDGRILITGGTSDGTNFHPVNKTLLITPSTSSTPVLSVSPVTQNVVKEAGTTTFSVSNSGTGTMAWTASVTSGSDWLSITSGSSGSNTGMITCAFTTNTIPAVRTGTIQVTAAEATGSPKDVTVTQAAGPIPTPTPTLTPTPTPTPTLSPTPVPTPTPYMISVSASPAEGGSVTGGGVYTAGTPVTTMAIPKRDWKFVNWSDGGSQVSTSASYTFTAIGNRALVANFQQEVGAGSYSKWLINISILGDTDEEYMHEFPKITTSGNYMHIVWFATKKANYNRAIFYTRSTDGGITFETPKKLIETSQNAIQFSEDWQTLAADSPYVNIAYCMNGSLLCLRSADDGTTFNSDNPIVLSGNATYSYSGVYITSQNGTSIIAWSEYHTLNNNITEKNIYCTRSTDGFATFERSTISSITGTQSAGIVDIARSGDYVYVLGYTYDNQYYDPSRLLLFSSWDGGVTFKSPVQVTIPASNGNSYYTGIQNVNYSPNIVADEKNVNIVWINNDNPGSFDGWWAPTLRTCRSTDGGLTLTTPITLHTYPEGYHSGAYAGQETIAANGSDIYITTILGDSPTGTYVWRSTDNGASWGESQRLSSGGWWPHIKANPNSSMVHLVNSSYFRSSDKGTTYTGGANPHLNINTWQKPDMTVCADDVVHYAASSGTNQYQAHIYYRRIAPEKAPGATDKVLSCTKSGTTRTDNIQIPANPNINFTSAMTSEFWLLRMSDESSYFNSLFSKTRGSLDSHGTYMVGAWDGFQIYGRLITDQTNVWLGTGVVLPKETWTHIAMTYDSSLTADNWKIYVNGVLKGKMDVKGNILSEIDSPLVVGYGGTQGPAGSFSIDELRMWNRALSQDEIAGSMYKTLSGNESGLTAYYNFNDTFKDITGKGYDAMPMYWESFVASNMLPALSVAPDTRNVAKESGTTTFNVSNTGSGTMSWTAAVTSGSSWLSITSGASGTNSGTITCAYTVNTNTTSRTGTIRVTANGANGSPKEVTVTQAAAPAGVSISGSVKTGSSAAISGVTITFSNSGGTATTDSGGNYGKSVSYGYSGTATPTKSGYTFSPSSKTFTNVTSNQTGQNFTGTPLSSSKQQSLGVWADGVWVWDKTTNKWTMMTGTASALMIATGKMDNDSVDDLIGVWTSGFYLRQSSNGQWIKLSAKLPTWIAAGDLNNDGRDEVIGTWAGDGLYYRDSVSGKWFRLASPARQLATGKFGGIRDDLAAVYNDGIWVRYSSDASWKKIDTGVPLWMTAGDMTGDNRADIVGSYGSGTWYRNSATGGWTKFATPAVQLAAGDMDGDGRDDLVGIWSNSVYVRYGATGQWQQISSSRPKWIATGKMTEAIQAAGSLEDPSESGEPILDLSDDGPGEKVYSDIDSDAGVSKISE